MGGFICVLWVCVYDDLGSDLGASYLAPHMDTKSNILMILWAISKRSIYIYYEEVGFKSEEKEKRRKIIAGKVKAEEEQQEERVSERKKRGTDV